MGYNSIRYSRRKKRMNIYGNWKDRDKKKDGNASVELQINGKAVLILPPCRAAQSGAAHDPESWPFRCFVFRSTWLNRQREIEQEFNTVGGVLGSARTRLQSRNQRCVGELGTETARFIDDGRSACVADKSRDGPWRTLLSVLGLSCFLCYLNINIIVFFLFGFRCRSLFIFPLISFHSSLLPHLTDPVGPFDRVMLPSVHVIPPAWIVPSMSFASKR